MGMVGDYFNARENSKATKKAAGLSADAANRAADMTQAQFEQTRSDLSPYTQGGNAGMNALLTGLTGQKLTYGTDGRAAVIGQAGQGDLMRSYGYQDFKTDPSYDFRLARGMDGVQSSAAAKGSLLSGAALKSLTDYNRGTFDQQYNNERSNYQTEQANRYGRLFSLANIGQSSAAQVGNAGAAAAQGVGQSLMAAGDARAGGVLGSRAIYSNLYGDTNKQAAQIVGAFL